MESRGPLAASPGLLLLLPLPPHGHQRIQDPPAVHLSSGSGQEPITIMTFDFTKIRKTSSSFELRTWDPEGVIFYGDTNPQKDCFVLGLRDGRPEIQMRNHLAQLTVGAGPRLDDGKWHQVEVKVLGDSLLLSVDGEEVLCLRQVSGPLAGKVQPVVRIALGGLLFPVSSLRLPLVPTLDGCLRRENWLDQQAQTSVSALLTSSLRSCAAESQPGTFFPPGTRAEFSLQASCRALGLLSGPGTPAGSRFWPPPCPWDPRKPSLAQPPALRSREASSASFCLDGLWAQGQKLDMDRALSRSQNIWTHSCPQSLGNDTDSTH
ncbi:sex hormone-binding globulin isoform X2 [Lynx canadensis]|uniref:Sex hormone-binding globulin n=1 Tax=Lynx canadensis TaxID=61383 RepID=A0A667GS75_LYNCA|nr:sex hormone-binding globulin isoform X2 [Lynx canadensis]